MNSSDIDFTVTRLSLDEERSSFLSHGEGLGSLLAEDRNSLNRRSRGSKDHHFSPLQNIDEEVVTLDSMSAIGDNVNQKTIYDVNIGEAGKFIFEVMISFTSLIFSFL